MVEGGGHTNKRTKKLICIIFTILIYCAILIISIDYPIKGEFYSSITNPTSEPKIIVAFRNDDLSALSDITKEKELMQIFWDKYHVPQTFAIIPKVSADKSNPDNRIFYPLNESKDVVDALKNWEKEGAIEFCQHGYTHQKGMSSSGEFGGLSYSKQFEKINNGKQLLDSVLDTDIDIFAPPWNQGDTNTLWACKNAGIDIYSGYLFSEEIEGLKVVNSNAYLDKRRAFPSFEEVFYEAKETTDTTLLIVWYHSYDWETESDYKYLDMLLQNITSNPIVEITTIGEIANKYPQLLNSYTIAELNLYSVELAEYRTKYYKGIFEKPVELFGEEAEANTMKLKAYQSFWRGDYNKTNDYCRDIFKIHNLYVIGSRLLIIPIALLTSFLLINIDSFFSLKLRRYNNIKKKIYMDFMAEIIFIGFIFLVLLFLNFIDFYSDFREMQISVFVTLYAISVASFSLLFHFIKQEERDN